MKEFWVNQNKSIDITVSERNAISVVRSCAMLMIVLCHLLQAYGNNLAWLFNAGVQVFFVLSGYLYGHKYIADWRKWFSARIRKLYIPVALFSVVMLTVMKFVCSEPVKLLNYVSYLLDIQAFRGGYNGLSHLWFMTAIAVCYATTPLLQRFKKFAPYLLLILLVANALIYMMLKKDIACFTWISLYSAGYCYARLGRFRKYALCFFSVLFVLLTCCLNWEVILQYDNVLNKAWHGVAGVVFCLLGIKTFSRLPVARLMPAIAPFDKYSFYIYITHHIFILGPLALIPHISSTYLAISLVVVSTILSTTALVMATNYINNKIIKTS